MPKKMWMVRAGEKAFLFQDFEEMSLVAIGWLGDKNLSDLKSHDDVAFLYKAEYQEHKPGKVRSGIGQISRFLFDVKKGDLVVTYSPEFRQYLVGEVVSGYKYRDGMKAAYSHIKEVKWIGKVYRDSLSVKTKNVLGSIMTLFSVNEDAAKEISDLLSGKSRKKEAADQEDTEPDTDLDAQKKEIQEKSKEYIKDLIQNLDWEEMQELVAGILRAMGYKTRVAPAGPDRGTDVIASPDGLGLEQPRIRVEVKHRGGAIGAPDLRSFIGGLRVNDRGLYVSTGGFTREARYEAERSTIPVTLIDIDELAELLISNYDTADTETKALVPLVKLYWPA